MGRIGRPVKTEGRDTRAAILANALTLFSEHGYDGASMRRIARASGIRESALYYYFASKEDLLRALIDAHGPAKAELMERELAYFVDKSTADELLRAVAHRVIEDWSDPEEARFMRLMMREGAKINARTDFYPLGQIEKARFVLDRLFARLIERKQIRKCEPAGAAIAFIGPLMMLRTLHFILPPSGKPDMRKMRADVDRFLTFFLSGLKP